MVITHEHVVSAIVGASSLYALLRVFAPLTPTDKDDKLVSGAESLRTWVEQKAWLIASVVEVAGKMGTLPAGVSKAIYFVELLRKAFADAHKSDLPKELEAVAMKIANEFSRQEKTVGK